MFQVPDGYILIKKEDYEYLLRTINNLTSRIEELEAQSKKNSQNSHKPPSTDAFNKSIKNNREKGKNKQGAQQGHKGTTLQMTANPDIVITHEVMGLCSCGEDLQKAEIINTINQQVIDFPVKLIEVTEHQTEVRQCKCGKIHQGEKLYQANVQYGERLKSFLIYANQYQLIPFERLQGLFEDCFGITISDGLIDQTNEKCYNNLSETEQRIKQALVESEVIHNDETGIRCETKLKWIHSCSNSILTHYGIQAKRGKEGMDNIGILPNFKGNSVHDRFSSYDNYTNCDHSLCNSHLLRELKYINEEIGRAWAGEMITLLVKANNAKKEDRIDESFQRVIENWYRHILSSAFKEEPPIIINTDKKRGRKARPKSLLLMEAFRDRKVEILRFLYEANIPFDNNLAERDIRMVKLKQKISGCFRTSHGAEVFCRIRSYLSTVRKQGYPVFDSICKAISGNPVQVIPALI
jgi:transposase